MTTYSGVPYDQPKSIEEWLEKRKMDEKYASVFTWVEEKVNSEYGLLFDRAVEYTEQIDSLSSQFQEISQTRKEYMQMNGIKQWSDLDSRIDAKHLAMQEHFSDELRESHINLNSLKKSRSNIIRGVRLLAGIIDGSYANFNSIIADERITHGMVSSNSGAPIWKRIGPVHNMFWSLHPKLI